MKRALVLSLICVLGLAFSGMAASLSGEWDTTITIDPTAAWPGALALASEITVVYEVGDWAFTSLTGLTDSGWDTQSFGVAGVLGAFSIGSDLVFDPSAPAFTSWTTDVGVSIAGVTFGADFELAGNDVTLVLSGSGVAGDVIVDVAVTFGGDDNDVCDLDWAGVVVGIEFPFCCADVTAEVAFDCTGFDYAEFAVGGITIGNLPWIALDATITFEVDNKTVELVPTFDPGAFGCISLDVDFAFTGGVDDVLSIGDISIAGFGLVCTLDNGVEFAGYTDWTGASEYFEWYTISTTDDGCCGPFGFDLGFYFADASGTLFEISLIDADMTLQVASQFMFKMGLEVDAAAGFSLWELGFEVTW